MYFAESAYSLRDGVAGKAAIEAVDAFLFGRARDDVVDAELIARHTGQPVAEVGPILESLAEHAALSVQIMVRCSDDRCRTLTPAARVDESRAEGDEALCDGPCGQDLAATADPETVTAYQVVAPPIG